MMAHCLHAFQTLEYLKLITDIKHCICRMLCRKRLSRRLAPS